MAAEQDKTVMGFKLGQVLGRGGFGFVKEAELNGHHYAMKVLTKGSKGWNSTEEKMVRAEIEIMKKLEHPHIIKVIEHNMNGKYPRDDGPDEDCVIIVMELAQGGNLFDILFFTDGFEESITRTYLYQLTDAIASMHTKGIAHRDIKPQNTLLDSNYNIKICDFGLSKQTDNASLMQTRLGTLPFQAPELLMGREYDFGVDIFALGVLYFLMLTGGVPPFKSAVTTDKWFKCIAGKAQDKFWKRHKAAKKKIMASCGAEGFDDAVQLFFWMCAYQPTERASIKNVADHVWLNKPKTEGAELAKTMKEVVNQAMIKKREDPEMNGQVSTRVRAMCLSNMDMEAVAPPRVFEGQDRFVPNFTYEIIAGTEENQHPYVVFKSIEDFLLEVGLEDDQVVFNPERFEMDVEAQFAAKDSESAKFKVLSYREGDANYISFKKGDPSISQTGINLLIKKIIERHCQVLGEIKAVEFKPTTTEQINDVIAHMQKMMAGNAEN